MDIEIKNLNKSFEDKIVLYNFNGVFKENNITFIMGTSGIGKTTLLRILMSLEKEDSGEINGLSDKRISAVFQDDSLCENLSVLLNIKLVCNDISNSEIEKALEELGLKDCLYKRVKELSGGMKRRVAILRAMLYDFDLIIMDEPFKGLDEETKNKVMDFVINRIKDKTAIVVTHDKEDVEYFNKYKELKIDLMENKF